MRVAFDPASPERLGRFGLGLGFTAPAVFTAEFLVEAPVHVAAAIDTARPLRIGAFTSIGAGRLRHVSIGRYCTIADGIATGWDEAPDGWVTTSPIGHVRDPHGWASLIGHDSYTPPDDFPPLPGATTIGHDVWIGQGVFLRPGISIGDGAVIAARSAVLADVPPYAIAEGAPARLLRPRFDDATVARLRRLQWWRYNLFHLPPELLRDVPRFLDHLEAAAPEPFEPGCHGPGDLASLIMDPA